MSTFAVAILHKVNVGAAITEYLERIDETLEPFGGRFLVHGGAVERLEGDWSGDLIVIEFPDRVRARGWYKSAAYQSILPLRAQNSQGDVILVESVPGDHRATDILAAPGRR